LFPLTRPTLPTSTDWIFFIGKLFSLSRFAQNLICWKFRILDSFRQKINIFALPSTSLSSKKAKAYLPTSKIVGRVRGNRNIFNCGLRYHEISAQSWNMNLCYSGLAFVNALAVTILNLVTDFWQYFKKPILYFYYLYFTSPTYSFQSIKLVCQEVWYQILTWHSRHNKITSGQTLWWREISIVCDKIIQRLARKQIKMQGNQKFTIIVQIPNPVPEPYLTNIFKTNWHIKFFVRCCIYLTTYDWIKSFLKITIEGHIWKSRE
jgi:hypothetical protein